jgi:hypothetical protein
MEYPGTISDKESLLKAFSMDSDEEAWAYLQEVSDHNERMRREFYERYEAARKAEAASPDKEASS